MSFLFALVSVIGHLPPGGGEEIKLPPGMTMEKAAQGWIALFDGETTYGLKIDGEHKIEQGILILNAGASLSTTTHFGTCEIVLEHGNTGGFKLSPPGDDIGTRMPLTNQPNKFDTFSMTVSNVNKCGPVKLSTESSTTLQIKSLLLKPLGATPIFNGKDLTGWKEIPGKKSKYSVTPQGELNVKDGNGDIQTEQQWDDFVLQLDVISNGDRLNSGVFFRCLPGEFWSGYEAQVRNEWELTLTMNDGTTSTGAWKEKDDNYELRTGRQTKSVPKSDVTAVVQERAKPVDFGSGGIYHFCKARRVVSTDREYFTMTVIAQGNHFAVWVNGYQTAEHTDNRPAHANARRGRKDSAGCFSLQGHDPTTDLSFKNIRVAALPMGTPR